MVESETEPLTLPWVCCIHACCDFFSLLFLRLSSSFLISSNDRSLYGRLLRSDAICSVFSSLLLLLMLILSNESMSKCMNEVNGMEYLRRSLKSLKANRQRRDTWKAQQQQKILSIFFWFFVVVMLSWLSSPSATLFVVVMCVSFSFK